MEDFKYSQHTEVLKKRLKEYRLNAWTVFIIAIISLMFSQPLFTIFLSLVCLYNYVMTYIIVEALRKSKNVDYDEWLGL